MAKQIQTKHLIIIIALALGAMLLLFLPIKSPWVYYLQDQLFSPGPVNYKHLTDLGQPITCQDCHRFGQVLNNAACVKCHTQQRFLENAAFLADAHRIFNKQDQCLRCHSEHGGTYTFITPVTLSSDRHRALPYDTSNCITCHEKIGKKAHPSLANNKCQNCHENYSWSSNFDHRKELSKAKTPQGMLALCRDCHFPDHHYNPVINNQVLTGCIFCHEFWGKRKEKKSIPFPDELFKDVKVDPKKFKFSPSRTN